MLRAAFFRFLTQLATRHARWVLLGTLALCAVSIALASSLQVKTNFKDMLGDDPIAVQQTYLEENFPGISTIQFVLSGGDRASILDAAEALETRLLASPEQVSSVTLEQPVDFFLEHSLLYLPADDLRIAALSIERWSPTLKALVADPSTLGLMRGLDTLGERVSRSSSTVSHVRSRMYGSMLLDRPDRTGMVTDIEVDSSALSEKLTGNIKRLIEPLPLPGSQDLTLENLRVSREALTLVADVLENGQRLDREMFRERAQHLQDLETSRLGAQRYMFSEDDSTLLMEAASPVNLADVELAIPVIEWVAAEMDDVALLHPDVTLQMTGVPVMIKEEGDAILGNFILVTILGFIGVLAVFVIGFERVGLPMLAAVPLVIGTVWTFGIIGAVSGQITLFSMMFPVLLFGIGIDFAIHLLSGYSERRATGAAPEQALLEAFERVGPGLLTGALTTAGAFGVMIFSDFFGLRDMGFTAGAGVLCALAAMLVILPTLVVAWDRHRSTRGALLPDVPFGFLGTVGELLVRLRYPVLAVTLGITIAFGYFASRIELDSNYMNVLPEGLASLEAQDRILEKFGSSNESVLFFADDLDEAREIAAQAQEAGTIAEVLSPSALLPTAAEQTERGPLIAQIGEQLAQMAPTTAPPSHAYGPEEIAELRDRMASIKLATLEMSMAFSPLYGPEVRDEMGLLRDQLNRIDSRLNVAAGERLVWLDELLAGEMRAGFALLQNMTANTTLTEDDLPAQITDKLHGEDGRWIVLVRATGDVWDSQFRTAFLREVQQIREENAGLVSSWDRMMALIIGELPPVLMMTAGMVGALVLIDLRSLRGTLLAVTPLVIGLIWTLGLLGLMGVPFNIINVISIPLIVGIGIDDGIHVYHRIARERSIGPALSHSGKAVILTTLTTGIGFGSLMLSIHPGIASLGLATTIGIVCCLVVSIFVMPALVAIFQPELLAPADPEGP